MHELTTDHTVICPSCWEEFTVLIDLSAGDQVVIEDCPVCCNPLQLALTVVDGELVSVDAEPAQ